VRLLYWCFTGALLVQKARQNPDRGTWCACLPGALLVLYWCFTGTKVRILTQLGEQMHPKFVAAEKLGAGNQSTPFFSKKKAFLFLQQNNTPEGRRRRAYALVPHPPPKKKKL
jgi:hypothetical protein